MTDDDREAAFQHQLDRTATYFDAVRENGDVPWFDDPEHLARLEPSFPGISDHPGIEARRMVFTGRYTRPEPPEGLQRDPRKPQHLEELPV